MQLPEASGQGFKLTVIYMQENATDRSSGQGFNLSWPPKTQLIKKAIVWKVQQC